MLAVTVVLAVLWNPKSENPQVFTSPYEKPGPNLNWKREIKDEDTFCTQEAKLCPDGHSVSRTGPNCEFTPCEAKMVGNDRDEHGCIGSAGYSWCEEKQKCLRVFEESCESLQSNSIHYYKTFSSSAHSYSIDLPLSWEAYNEFGNPKNDDLEKLMNDPIVYTGDGNIDVQIEFIKNMNMGKYMSGALENVSGYRKIKEIKIKSGENGYIFIDEGEEITATKEKIETQKALMGQYFLIEIGPNLLRVYLNTASADLTLFDKILPTINIVKQ